MNNKNIFFYILIIFLALFIYGTIKAITIVNKREVSTNDGIYKNYVSTSNEIKTLSHNLTKNSNNKLEKVSILLDYVTNIPYKTKLFQQSKPLQTIQQNFGDCDDKSNLLISMLHSLGIEAYLVLVPKHIFVIVAIDDNRLSDIQGLWIDGKKYYILETTAKGSNIGFELKYKINQIDTIIEPFSNKKLDYNRLEFR